MEREWLKEQLEAGRSYEAIGREVGCSPSKVAYWARKHGLTSHHAPRHRSRGGIEADVLADLLDEGLSIRGIAARLDCSAATVRHWLGRHGLQTQAAAHRTTRIAATREVDGVRICPTHGPTPHVARASGYRCRACQAEQVARRRRRVKEILVTEAGGACVVCGYDRCIRALEFHHLDPGDKRFGLAHRGLALAIDAIRAEASKCVLLCSNCHAEVESGLVDLAAKIDVPG